MTRKFMLLALLAAAVVPAGIKAAAEPLRSSSHTPLYDAFLLLDDSAIAAQLVQFITKGKSDLINRMFELMRLRYTTRADARHIRNIRNLIKNSIFMCKYPNIGGVVDAFLTIMENDLSKQAREQRPTSQCLHREPSAQTIEVAEKALDETFPLLDDDTIAATLIEYINQENSKLAQCMIAHLENKYDGPDGVENIQNILRLVRTAQPTTTRKETIKSLVKMIGKLMGTAPKHR